MVQELFLAYKRGKPARFPKKRFEQEKPKTMLKLTTVTVVSGIGNHFIPILNQQPLFCKMTTTFKMNLKRRKIAVA
jgi:hypothetical protein